MNSTAYMNIICRNITSTPKSITYSHSTENQVKRCIQVYSGPRRAPSAGNGIDFGMLVTFLQIILRHMVTPLHREAQAATHSTGPSQEWPIWGYIQHKHVCLKKHRVNEALNPPSATILRSSTEKLTVL